MKFGYSRSSWKRRQNSGVWETFENQTVHAWFFLPRAPRMFKLYKILHEVHAHRHLTQKNMDFFKAWRYLEHLKKMKTFCNSEILFEILDVIWNTKQLLKYKKMTFWVFYISVQFLKTQVLFEIRFFWKIWIKKQRREDKEKGIKKAKV